MRYVPAVSQRVPIACSCHPHGNLLINTPFAGCLPFLPSFHTPSLCILGSPPRDYVHSHLYSGSTLGRSIKGNKVGMIASRSPKQRRIQHVFIFKGQLKVREAAEMFRSEKNSKSQGLVKIQSKGRVPIHSGLCQIGHWNFTAQGSVVRTMPQSIRNGLHDDHSTLKEKVSVKSILKRFPSKNK